MWEKEETLNIQAHAKYPLSDFHKLATNNVTRMGLTGATACKDKIKPSAHWDPYTTSSLRLTQQCSITLHTTLYKKLVQDNYTAIPTLKSRLWQAWTRQWGLHERTKGIPPYYVSCTVSLSDFHKLAIVLDNPTHYLVKKMTMREFHPSTHIWPHIFVVDSRCDKDEPNKCKVACKRNRKPPTFRPMHNILSWTSINPL